MCSSAEIHKAPQAIIITIAGLSLIQAVRGPPSRAATAAMLTKTLGT